MRQIRRHTSTPFPRIFLKNPARWAEPPGQARTRSPSQFPGHTAIGTNALGLLFLRRKVAKPLILPIATAFGPVLDSIRDFSFVTAEVFTHCALTDEIRQYAGAL